jgi:hypothetical protein
MTLVGKVISTIVRSTGVRKAASNGVRKVSGEKLATLFSSKALPKYGIKVDVAPEVISLGDEAVKKTGKKLIKNPIELLESLKTRLRFAIYSMKKRNPRDFVSIEEAELALKDLPSHAREEIEKTQELIKIMRTY